MTPVQPRFRTLGLWLVACALALRMIVAPGFMPVVDDASVTVAMCTGSGSTDIRIPGKPDMPMPQSMGCAFAALALAAPPGMPAVLAAPVQVAAVAHPLPPMAARPHLGTPAPPPPAIGPPLLA